MEEESGVCGEEVEWREWRRGRVESGVVEESGVCGGGEWRRGRVE